MEMVFFLEKRYFDRKKSACGNTSNRGASFLGKKKRLRQYLKPGGVVFGYKKAPAAIPQTEGSGVFPREVLFWQKKAPAAIAETGENGKNHENLHKTANLLSVLAHIKSEYVFFNS